MKKISVEIEGKTPLLMNRFIDTQIEEKAKKRTGNIKEIRPEDKLYLVNDEPYIPSVYIRNSLIEAGKSFKIQGKGKSNFSKLIGATIEIKPDCLILKPNEWKPFRISAVNPMTKGRMIVTRPKFEEWGLQFEIILNDDSIDASTINEILVQAGNYVGVGDWRPEKKGMHGQFMITSFKEVE